MKIEGKISIFISATGTIIQIKDNQANAQFVEVFLTPEELSMALGRQAHVPCKIDVYNIEKIGKKHENESFVFEIPPNLTTSRNSDELQKIAQSLLSDGWIADGYFGSQNSFFQKDGKHYARCTIRRWI